MLGKILRVKKKKGVPHLPPGVLAHQAHNHKMYSQ